MKLTCYVNSSQTHSLSHVGILESYLNLAIVGVVEGDYGGLCGNGLIKEIAQHSGGATIAITAQSEALTVALQAPEDKDMPVAPFGQFTLLTHLEVLYHSHKNVPVLCIKKSILFIF